MINKYKPFFEDIENKIKLLPENKRQFNEEEKENIINKMNNFKISLFNLVNIITSKKEENKLEIEIQNVPENLDKENTAVIEQTPKEGITVNEGSKIFVK
jgi:hypothetical protein